LHDSLELDMAQVDTTDVSAVIWEVPPVAVFNPEFDFENRDRARQSTPRLPIIATLHGMATEHTSPFANKPETRIMLRGTKPFKDGLDRMAGIEPHMPCHAERTWLTGRAAPAIGKFT